MGEIAGHSRIEIIAYKASAQAALHEIYLLKSCTTEQVIAAAGSRNSLRQVAKTTECQTTGYCMRTLREFRAGKPEFYPDQAVYAAFSSADFGLGFEDLDGGTGLVFQVSSSARTAHFGAGRCSY